MLGSAVLTHTHLELYNSPPPEKVAQSYGSRATLEPPNQRKSKFHSTSCPIQHGADPEPRCVCYKSSNPTVVVPFPNTIKAPITGFEHGCESLFDRCRYVSQEYSLMCWAVLWLAYPNSTGGLCALSACLCQQLAFSEISAHACARAS